MALISLNLLKLRAQARAKAGVAVADYSNALLDDQLNIAYVALATMLANLGEDYFEEQNVKFSLIANSGLYSLPTDFMALKQIRLAYTGTPVASSAYVVAHPYDVASVHSISGGDENFPVSQPRYDITGNYYRLKPKPTVAVTNGGLLDYIAMPSALANTGDVPVIPVRYHDKIAVYGAKEMALKYQKWNKWKALNTEWETLMGELEDKIADRDLNVPLTFRSPHEVVPDRRVREL